MKGGTTKNSPSDRPTSSCLAKCGVVNRQILLREPSSPYFNCQGLVRDVGALWTKPISGEGLLTNRIAQPQRITHAGTKTVMRREGAPLSVPAPCAENECFGPGGSDRERQKEWGKSMTLTSIGSDPEFVLVRTSDGSFAKAYEFLGEQTNNPVGCDGRNTTGELRPKAGRSPEEHWSNIQCLIGDLSTMIPPTLSVRGGTCYHPQNEGQRRTDAIGGHIHFGGIKPKEHILRALDFYLALPMELIEDPDDVKFRHLDAGYGVLSNYETKAWGFEYRTLPSWLTGGDIAMQALTMAWVIADAADRGLAPVPEEAPPQRAFRYCDKETLRQFLPLVRRGWKQMPLFSQGKNALRFAAFNERLVSRKVWRFDRDIRLSWKIGFLPGMVLSPQEARKIQIETSPTNLPPGELRAGSERGCAEIVEGIDMTQFPGIRVVVYGFKDDTSTFDIAINHQAVANSLWADDYSTTTGVFGVYRQPEWDGWYRIGLSPRQRNRVSETREIVRRIIDQLWYYYMQSQGRPRPH
jgi:hypothetical protein